MQIFLDTVNTEEIRKGLEFGIIDGIMTSPSRIAREKRKILPLIMKQFRRDWGK